MIGTHRAGNVHSASIAGQRSGGRRATARAISSQHGPTASTPRHSAFAKVTFNASGTAAAPSPSARAQTAAARHRPASQGAAGRARRRQATTFTVARPHVIATRTHVSELCCHTCVATPVRRSARILQTIGPVGRALERSRRPALALTAICGAAQGKTAPVSERPPRRSSEGRPVMARVAREMVEKAGVDVDELVRLLVANAGAELTTFYYYTILRVNLIGLEG